MCNKKSNLVFFYKDYYNVKVALDNNTVNVKMLLDSTNKDTISGEFQTEGSNKTLEYKAIFSKENKDDVILIANTLLDKETITAEEIEYLLAHRTLDGYKSINQSEVAASLYKNSDLRN